MPGRGIIADEVDEWAFDEKREDENFRIGVCGYEHNFNIAEYEKRNWQLCRWKPSIGFRSGNADPDKIAKVVEITAFSPQCNKIPKEECDFEN